MKVLYHECTDHEGTKMDVEFCDGNGRLWVIPFGEPTEFENAYMADRILEHQKFMGLVEVTFTKTRGGLVYEIEDAKRRALACLVAEEKQCVNDYVRGQLESRVKANFPPLPPTGRALSCVIKLRVNLLAYGLRPVGWEPPYQVDQTPGGNQQYQPSAPASGNMDERIKQLENLVVSQQNMINGLIQAKSGGAVDRSLNTKLRSVAKPTAAEVLARDANPAPSPVASTEGAEDTIESIRL